MIELLLPIRGKIVAYHRMKWKAKTAEGLSWFIIASSLLFLSMVLLELAFHFSSTLRTVLFFSWMLTSVAVFGMYVVRPLLKCYLKLSREDIIRLSGEVGWQYPQIKDNLTNVIELVLQAESEGYSHPFTELALHRVIEQAKNIDFNKLISTQRMKGLLRLAFGTGLISLLLIVAVPGLKLAAGRVILYSKSFLPPPKFFINVLPGNVKITRGNDLPGKVFVYGEKPQKVWLYSKLKEESSFQKKELESDSSGEFPFQFRALHSDLEYFAAAEDIESSHCFAQVVDRPIIKELHVQVEPPAYSKLPLINQIDNGSFTCLYGSKVTFSLESSAELREAKIILNDSLSYPLHINGTHASADYVPHADASYKILIKDSDGNENESPVNYSIKLFYDAPPGIELLAPRGDSFLESSQRNTVSVRITDDYGFSSLILYYRLSKSDFDKPQEKYTTLSIPFDRSKNDQTATYIWNLAELSLAAGDVISYYIEVADNNSVSGPQKARTAELTIRQPSVSEIAKHTETEQARVEQELAKSMKEAEELKKEIAAISRDLMKDKKDLSYEEKERMKAAAKKFEELKDNLSNVKKNLQDAVKDMQKNNLLSKETMEKYLELQKLMKELDNAELQKMLERMQQNNHDQDRKQAQMDMQNMKNFEEMFQKSIERTMNLLKRVMIEQKMNQLSKEAESIQKEQQEVSEKTGQSKQNDAKSRDELSKQQQNVTKQLDQFKKDMQDLASKMNEFKDMPNEMAKDIKKEFQEEKNEELSEEAQKEIQQNMSQSASQKQNEVSKNMQKMSKKLQNMQSAMQQQQQQKVFADMMKMMNEMLETSRMQEQLKDKSRQGEHEMSFKENARQQQDLRQDIESIMQQMSALSQKTFAISPDMGKELGDAQRSMDQAVKSLQNRNGNAASESQADAMKSINQSARMLKEAAEGMMQGGQQGGGGGMMSLMQQLGKISGQQMNLNNMAQQLMRGQGGQMSRENMQMMERLTQQQQMIQKSLQELSKEASSSTATKKLSNSLDPITQQMEEVVSEMKSRKYDDGLVQKQERILSRLLDAQLSVNERDYEKDRESNTGKNIPGISPKDPGKQKKDNRLHDELMNSMHEAYIKDYEALIRKYLEKLGSEAGK